MCSQKKCHTDMFFKPNGIGLSILNYILMYIVYIHTFTCVHIYTCVYANIDI